MNYHGQTLQIGTITPPFEGAGVFRDQVNGDIYHIHFFDGQQTVQVNYNPGNERIWIIGVTNSPDTIHSIASYRTVRD